MRLTSSVLVIARGVLSEHVVVVDKMMIANVSEFGMAWFGELEDDAVGAVNAKALHFMLLRMEFFDVQRRMKGVGLEEVCLDSCFALNGLGKLVEKTVKCGGRLDIDHI